MADPEIIEALLLQEFEAHPWHRRAIGAGVLHHLGLLRQIKAVQQINALVRSSNEEDRALAISLASVERSGALIPRELFALIDRVLLPPEKRRRGRPRKEAQTMAVFERLHSDLGRKPTDRELAEALNDRSVQVSSIGRRVRNYQRGRAGGGKK